MRLFIYKLLVAALLLNALTVIAHADALDNWTSCQLYNPAGPYAPGLQLLGVAYGNGQYVAVGQFVYDDNGIIETSKDGINWTLGETNADYPVDIYKVAYGNGTFVAVGWDGYGEDNLYSFTNATNWIAHASRNLDVYGVTYGGGLFVAVGDGYWYTGGGVYTNKNILTSSDGVNWIARSSGAPANDVDSLADVAYGSGTFVAVSSANTPTGSAWGVFHTSMDVHTSTGGIIWTRTTLAYPLAGSVSYCNGLFIAPSGPGTNLISPNGTTWSVLTNNTADTFGRVIYTNGLYVAISSSSIYTSTDATNWSPRIFHPSAGNVLSDVVFGKGNIVAIGYSSSYLATGFISDPFVGLGVSAGTSPQLKLSGINGWSYGIQYSGSLNPASWQTLTNFTLSNSPSIWTDPAATNSQRFYRAALTY